MDDQDSNHRVKLQQVISSAMVTSLSERDEWNYLIEIGFRVVL